MPMMSCTDSSKYFLGETKCLVDIYFTMLTICEWLQ